MSILVFALILSSWGLGLVWLAFVSFEAQRQRAVLAKEAAIARRRAARAVWTPADRKAAHVWGVGL
jgi:hypothetical protein